MVGSRVLAIVLMRCYELALHTKTASLSCGNEIDNYLMCRLF